MKNLLLSIGGDLRYLDTHHGKRNAGDLWWVVPSCVVAGFALLFGYVWLTGWWSERKENKRKKE